MKIPIKTLLAKAWVWLEPRLKDEIQKELDKRTKSGAAVRGSPSG